VEQCKQARRELLTERLRSAILECRHGGLSVSEIRGLFQEAVQDTAHET
jgi:DNA-binding transcriptional regulator YhcF (GntR family)